MDLVKHSLSDNLWHCGCKIFTGRTPFLSSEQQCEALKGKYILAARQSLEQFSPPEGEQRSRDKQTKSEQLGIPFLFLLHASSSTQPSGSCYVLQLHPHIHCSQTPYPKKTIILAYFNNNNNILLTFHARGFVLVGKK